MLQRVATAPSARSSDSSTAGAGSASAPRSRVHPGVQIDVDAHPVLGQRPGLVGADDACRSERFDGAQALDDRAAADQLARADGKCQGDYRQQAFGHESDQQSDGEDDRVANRESGDKGRDRHERRGREDGDQRDQPGDLAHLPLERRFVALNALGEARDPPQLGLHPGREDDGASLSLGAGGTGKDQVARL